MERRVREREHEKAVEVIPGDESEIEFNQRRLKM